MNARLKLASDLMLFRDGSDKKFCENIIKQGKCSEKQYTILKSIEQRWLKSITPRGCYYEECYEENTNSYY